MINFVGAGSGAVDLITVRGMNHLKEADCVVYAGSLVNPELLKYCKPDVEIFNSATMDFDEVMEILISRDRQGKKVVRLHTGDPALYGSIGEQIKELDANEINYDVTPGVTAAFAAAATCNMEMTLPGISQTVILSRTEGRTPMPEKESIENLAKTGATLCIYLSAIRVEKLQEDLLKGGLNEDTPVAICYKVSWPEEKIFYSTIAKMVDDTKKENLTLTTLFIIGQCVNPKDFDRSKLYSSDFSTCYRSAKTNTDSHVVK